MATLNTTIVHVVAEVPEPKLRKVDVDDNEEESQHSCAGWPSPQNTEDGQNEDN
ncbi:MAG: hypothetical protein II885_10365 [Oscillospiraceae bacterium]|nr:hypothetical protein [Oscillospiraceae bacterium]